MSYSPPSASRKTLSILIAFGAVGAAWGVFAAMTPILKDRSGLDNSGFGLLLLALAAGALPSLLIFGRFVSRVERWALPSCLIAMGIAVAWLSFAQDIYALIVAFLILGSASGALDIALNMRVSTLENENAVRLFQRAHGVLPMASVLGSIASGFMREAGVVPALLFLAAAIILAAAALSEGLIARHSSNRSKEKDNPEPEASDSLVSGAKPWGFLLLLGAIGALGASQEMTGTNWSAIYVEEALGTGAGIGGLAAGLFLVGVSLGRFGAHRIQASVSDLIVLRLCAGFGIFAFGTISLAQVPTLALFGFLAAGFSVGPVEPTVYHRATHKAPRDFKGAWLSTVTSISYIGYLTSPVAVGASVQWLGWSVTWGLLGAVGACVILLSLTSAITEDST